MKKAGKEAVRCQIIEHGGSASDIAVVLDASMPADRLGRGTLLPLVGGLVVAGVCVDLGHVAMIMMRMA